MSDGRAKVRPITIMAVLGVLALAAAGLYAWGHGSSSTGTPAALPITVGSTTASGKAAADIALYPGQPSRATIFVAAPDLPTLGGTAPAWRLGGAPDAATVTRLGAALGVHGAAVAEDGGWTMGSTGGTQLHVSRGAGNAWSWSVNESATVVSPPVACARPLPQKNAIGPGDSVSTEPCGMPATTVPEPVDVPDRSSAERQVRDLLDRAGLDVTGWKVTTTVDAYSASVSASPVLDGVTVEGLADTVILGAHGAVTYASGFLGTPERVDTYPLIGTRAAIADLQKGESLGVEPMPAEAEMRGLSGTTITNLPTMTTTTVAATPPTEGVASGTASRAASGGDVVETPRGAPSAHPSSTTLAPIRVTVDHVELVLSAQVGTDGAMWLVPAYRFTAGTAGGSWTVLAVDRRYVAPPPVKRPPATIEPPGFGGGSTSGSSGGSSGWSTGTAVVTPATAPASTTTSTRS